MKIGLTNATRDALEAVASTYEINGLLEIALEIRDLLAASSAATVSDAASVGAECSHRIVDARNEGVKSG